MKSWKEEICEIIEESFDFKRYEEVRTQFRANKNYNAKEDIITEIHYVVIDHLGHQEELIIDKGIFDFW